MLRRAVWVVIVSAACKRSGDAPAALPHGDCPAPDRVVHTAWLLGGWKVILHVRLDGVGSGYETIDERTARAAGIERTPTHVWIRHGDDPPCRAKATRHFRFNHQYGVELTGCPAPGPANEPFLSLGLAGSEDLSRCLWTMVDLGGEPTIPAPIAELVTQRPCIAPDCEHAVNVTMAGKGDTAIGYDVAQAWLGADADRCTVGEAFDIVVRGPRGWTRLALPAGPNQPLLAGVFHDAAGARIVALQGYGTHDIYTFDAAGTSLTRELHYVWTKDPETKPFRYPIVRDCPARR